MPQSLQPCMLKGFFCEKEAKTAPLLSRIPTPIPDTFASSIRCPMVARDTSSHNRESIVHYESPSRTMADRPRS